MECGKSECPAIRYPDINRSDITRYANKNEVELMKEKIRMMLKVGHIYPHDTMVLSAVGCGAWGSPPEHTAELFSEVISEFAGAFKYIIFAVLKSHDNKNFDVFHKNLNNLEYFAQVMEDDL